MQTIHHALVLNLHQPPGNLDDLLEHRPWEAKEILFAMDRIPRSLWPHEGLGRVHLSLSGALLETLASPGFQQRVYGTVDCGSLLWHWQNEKIIRVLGTGYYHPVLPLIPEADRPEHLQRWHGLAGHLFGNRHFQGFWPPEMGFSMELIPLLKRMGYRYVMVDSDYIQPVTSMSWVELRYRPHIARYGEDEIIVVVRDRELSDAQESGMGYDWFSREVHARTRWCGFEPLVTTCSDGDNGGWFRDTSKHNNFWDVFYADFMERAAQGEDDIRPAFIDDYLDRHGAHGEVIVETGAWNTGWHHGRGFTQWTGSQAQKDVLARTRALSERLHRLRSAGGEIDPERLEPALWPLLRAETSCNLFWGEAWVGKAHADLDRSERRLEALEGAAEHSHTD